MKRSFLFLVAAATGLIATTYGLVRLAYGLYLPNVQEDLGLSTGAAGLIAALASVVYCLGAACGFLLSDRHPRTLVLLAGATAALGCVGMAVGGDAGAFGFGAVLSSAGAGLASPAVVELIRRHAPGDLLDRSQSVANAGTGPGLIVAGSLALLLLPLWRAGWWIAAGLAVLATTLVLAADSWSSGARTTVRGRTGPTAGSAARRVPGVPPRQWRAAHRRPFAVALLLGIGSAAVWSYGRSLLVELGADDRASTVAWIALGVGGAAVLATSRWLVARRIGAAWAVTGGAVAVATIALPSVGTHPTTTGAVCAMFGWGYTAASGVLITWTGRIDPERSGSGTAALFVTLVLGQAIGAAGWGALTGPVGHPATFGLAAAVAAVAVLVGARAVPTDAARAAGPGHAGGGPA